ncbi:MAG: DUF4197 domain-containing protein [Bacteroidota bacterium]
MRSISNRIQLCLIVLILFGTGSCAELQQVVNQLPQGGTLGNAEIAQGLREALNKGIDQQVSKLASENGFFNNELVRILLPEELQKVDKTLRDIGLSNLADEGLQILNRAAEDAVGTATPIFVNAVKNITFDDARTILLGADNAATAYLQGSTEQSLYNAFNPVIEESFTKVGADRIWNTLITEYNKLPFTKKVNPNLTDYVTQEALNGVFTMIQIEEKNIRNKVSSRTSTLLKQVFALQD